MIYRLDKGNNNNEKKVEENENILKDREDINKSNLPPKKKRKIDERELL